jgi:two-component system sensor histidine kinase BarA
MKIHRKIALSNTIIFTLYITAAYIFLKENTSLLILKNHFFIKITPVIILFFIMSNFISKFILITIYNTLEKLDKIISVINNKFIFNLRKDLLNMEGCFHQIFSSIKIDILDILVKEGEIKNQKEKAEELSDKLTLLNKNLEQMVEKRTIELKSAKEYAEAANRSKNEFLAKISHEMRTPLTPIIGYSRMLKKSDLSDDAKEKLETIHNSGVKLLNFTNELLDFSKIEAGTVDLHFEPFDIKDFFKDIYNEHSEKAEEKNIKFEIELPQNDITIYSDKMKLYEIVKNLVHNAIKYTEKGSVLCAVEIKDSTLYFDVYDSGIGISNKNISYIFESFGQINKQSAGAGLGLSITKKLVEILKGDIKVESRLGIGTTFNINIPIEVYKKSDENFSFNLRKLLNKTNPKIKPIILKSILKFPIRLKNLKESCQNKSIEEIRKFNHEILGTYGNLNMAFIYGKAKNISAELKKDKVNFENIMSFISELENMNRTLEYDSIFKEYLNLKNKKLSILIAEDVEENRDFLRALLESESVELVCVENGLLALKKLQENKFDIILLDIQMPVMDGIQTLLHIKSNFELKKIPTLALTAQAIVGDKEKYIPLGFDEYITKPINEPIFFSHLEHFINMEKED